MSKSFSIIFLFLSFFANAQKKQIDSLNILLKNAKHDTTQIRCLYLIGEMSRNFRITYWDSLGNNCELLLEKSKNNPFIKRTTLKYLSGVYNNIGTLAEEQNNKQKAIDNHYKSLKIREELKDEPGIAESYYNIGIFYINNGDITNGVEAYNKSLVIQEKRKDKQHIADVLNRLAIVYRSQGITERALDYFHKSLKIQEEIKNKRGEAVSLNNIASIYSNINETEKSLEYYKRAYNINEGLGDKRGAAYYFQSIGVVYQNEKNEKKALENFKKALNIYEANNIKNPIPGCLINISNSLLKQDSIDSSALYAKKALKLSEELAKKDEIIRALNLLSSIYLKQDKIEEAIKYAERSLSLAKELNFLPKINTAYYDLSKAYRAVNRDKDAYEMLLLYKQTTDSLNKINNTREIAKKRYQFEYEKKSATDSINYLKETEIKNAEFRLLEKEKSIEIENLNQLKLIDELTIKNKESELLNKNIETINNQKQIKGLEKEKILNNENIKQQKFIQKLILSGLALLLVFSSFLVMSFRKTRKANKIIAHQKTEVEEQKHLVEEKHKEITDSINYAERIQRSLLASKELLNENLNESFVFFKPKDVVSGDFYWATTLSNNQFALVTADSTGHGVPGAIMSILNISCLKETVKEGIIEPSEILNHTRNKIIEILKKDGSIEGGKDGMDCSLISFDLTNNKLTYSAANNPIWIVREKQIIEFSPDKMPVGKHDRDTISFTQHTIELQKNDMIYTLTDGMPDQFGGLKGKKYMYKQLKELLISMSDLSMNEQKEKISESLNSWIGELEQVDDITIIGIKV